MLYGLTAALSVPAGARAQTPPAGRTEIRAIEFSGVRAAEPDTLRGAIMSRATQCRLPILFPPCWIGLVQDRHYFDPAMLRSDVIRIRLFYFRKGYREATVGVDTTRADDGVRIVFRIDEGRPVRVTRLTIEDDADVAGDDIARRLPIAVGDPFDMLAVEAARDTLANGLRDRGYPRAEVLVRYFVPADSHSARLRYILSPGPRARFGEIDIVGADAVAPSVIRRMLTFRAGDTYRRSELLRSQRRLYELGVFRHIEIQARPDAAGPDTLVPVAVQVNEGDVHRVRFGAGLNTVDAVNAEGSWTSRSFLGGARRLEVQGRIANVFAKDLARVNDVLRYSVFETADDPYGDYDGSFSIDFTQPWFFHPSMALNTGVLAERRSVPDVFVRTAWGGYLSVSRSLGRRTSLSLGYRPERNALTAEGDLFFCVNYRACEADDIDVLDRPHWLAPVVLSFARDRSNAIFSPTDGYIVRLDAEYAAGLTSRDPSYTRISSEASWYEDVSAGWVFAARLRAGVANVIGSVAGGEGLGLVPQKRFFAGGPNSVRGFAYYRLGPKVLTVDAAGDLYREEGEPDSLGCVAARINDGTCDAASLADARPDAFAPRPVGGAAVLEGSAEIRFPVWRDRLRGAAFVDFGQVWSRDQDIDVGRVAWTPGLGIRYRSPIGPIRVDVAYNTTGTERLPVFTTRVCGPDAGIVCPDGDGGDGVRNTNRLVRLDRPVLWDPADSFFDRLQVHFSIGQAF